MGQRISLEHRLRMIVRVDRSGKTGINAKHHGIRVARPSAHDLNIFGQPIKGEVLTAIMRIFDHHFGGTCGKRSLAGGQNLARHQIAKFFVIGMAAFGFIPMGDAGGAFDVS